MGYRYGGKMDPEKKHKIAKAIVCLSLVAAIFSDMTPILARHHYHYRMPDGSIRSTRHRYGWGDWDDFAYYSQRVNHNIPVRDDKVRSLWREVRDINGNEPLGIVAMVKTIKEATETREDSSTEGRKLDVDVLININTGDLNDVITKFRNPKKLLSGVQVSILGRNTAVNPLLPIDGNKSTVYTQKEMEEGLGGKIAKDKIEYQKETNREATEEYNKAMEEMEVLQKDLEKLSKEKDDGDSIVSSQEREEALLRARMAVQRQQEVIDGIEARRRSVDEKTQNDLLAIHNHDARASAHMPTAKEFKKEVEEKRRLHSTSHDLGFRKFGQSKKANFSKVLDKTVNPKFETKAKE